MSKKRTAFFIAGAVVVGTMLVKKEWRTCAFEGVRQAKQKVRETVTFVRDNRAHIVAETKGAVKEIRGLGQEIAGDVTTLLGAARHLKTSSEEALHVAKGAIEDIKKDREDTNV